jgi:hypothetical protein
VRKPRLWIVKTRLRPSHQRLHQPMSLHPRFWVYLAADVLGSKVFGHVLLALVKPAREGNEQEPKRIKWQMHPDRTPTGLAKRRARLAPSWTCKLFPFHTDRVFGHRILATHNPWGTRGPQARLREIIRLL